MKKIVVFCIVYLFCMDGFSQFPIHTLLPMVVSGVGFGDTLLNTHAVLLREGIKKITAYQTSSRDRGSFTTTYTVNDGRIESRAWCYRRSPDSAFRFCLHDTLLYNNKGGLQDYWSGNSKETAQMKMTREDKGAGHVTITWITKDPQRPAPHISIYHQVYNNKGQLISQQYDPKEKYIVNASLYYNADGLPDSIRHENPEWGTYVFNRRQKGRNTVLTLESARVSNKWVYNQAGQCLSSVWLTKYSTTMRNSDKGTLFSEVDYHYNKDGTLSKVVEKNAGYKVTTVYSYTR
ncbi:MAG: hypothetical protein JWR72_1898 [Flavisolibacter sp.]|nr:hypothetical protein [Flavisolibacter sp.]